MNDILTEREACAKIADGFKDSTWIMTSHNYDRIVGYRDASMGIAAAIRARPAPEPVITDEMVSRAHAVLGSFFSADEVRAALVAALGGK